MNPDAHRRAGIASTVVLITAFGLASIGTTTTSARAAQPAGLLTDFYTVNAIIETSRDICLQLDLYLADTPSQQAQGLMFIEKLNEFEGMLFRHSRPALITMWMKNTYIPLDMLFLKEDGTIATITTNTTPLSTKRISSRESVSAVLEVNGGFTDRWNIEAGDRLLTKLHKLATWVVRLWLGLFTAVGCHGLQTALVPFYQRLQDRPTIFPRSADSSARPRHR